MRAARERGQVAWALQIGQLWPGIGDGCQGTHGPTAALLSRVPSSSVLKPYLGDKRGHVGFTRRKAFQLYPSLTGHAGGNDL